MKVTGIERSPDVAATTNDRAGVFIPLWAMADCGGDARDAIVLSQITWWLQPGQRDGTRRSRQIIERDGETWLYLTDDQLAEEVGLSGDQVYRARLSLKRLGLIIWQIRKVAGARATLIRPVTRDSAISETATSRDSQTATPRNEPNRDSAESTVTEARLEDGKETARAEATARFDEHFWPAYPTRNGRRLDKGKALAQWLKLSIDEQRAAVKGARHYAADGQIPKDAHRWLRDRCWEDWVLPPAGGVTTRAAGGSRDEQVMAATDEVRRRLEERETR